MPMASAVLTLSARYLRRGIYIVDKQGRIWQYPVAEYVDTVRFPFGQTRAPGFNLIQLSLFLGLRRILT
jgi:hypothetical protein